MKILIALTLHQRLYTGTLGSLHKRKATQVCNIDPVVGDRFYDRGIIRRYNQFDPRAGLLFQIVHDRPTLTDNLSWIGRWNHRQAKHRLRIAGAATVASYGKKYQKRREHMRLLHFLPLADRNLLND